MIHTWSSLTILALVLTTACFSVRGAYKAVTDRVLMASAGDQSWITFFS